MYMRVNIFANMLSQQKADEEQQNNLNGVTEILKFGASLVEGFIALMGQKVIVLIFSPIWLWEQKENPKVFHIHTIENLKSSISTLIL